MKYIDNWIDMNIKHIYFLYKIYNVPSDSNMSVTKSFYTVCTYLQIWFNRSTSIECLQIIKAIFLFRNTYTFVSGYRVSLLLKPISTICFRQNKHHRNWSIVYQDFNSEKSALCFGQRVKRIHKIYV